MKVTFHNQISNQILNKKLDCFKFPALNARRNINLSKCCNLTWNINERNCDKKRCISTDIVRSMTNYLCGGSFAMKFIRKVCSCSGKKGWNCADIAKTCLSVSPPAHLDAFCVEAIACCISKQFSKSNLTFTAWNQNKTNIWCKWKSLNPRGCWKLWEVKAGWNLKMWEALKLAENLREVAKSCLCVSPLFSVQLNAFSTTYHIYHFKRPRANSLDIGIVKL